MSHSSNNEPRRFWRLGLTGTSRARCQSCGERAAIHRGEVPFCDACLDWTRQSKLADWDDLGAVD
jgi:hypothetical protein